MTEARKQADALLAKPECRERLLATARIDIGVRDADEFSQQVAMEFLRAAGKLERLEVPESFMWACYRNCRRDALRKRERMARRETV